jgi:hypothetical protein
MFDPEASGNHPQGLALNMNPMVSKAVRTTKQSNCRGNGLCETMLPLIW